MSDMYDYHRTEQKCGAQHARTASVIVGSIERSDIIGYMTDYWGVERIEAENAFDLWAKAELHALSVTINKLT